MPRSAAGVTIRGRGTRETPCVALSRPVRLSYTDVPDLDDALPENSDARDQYFTEDELEKFLAALDPSCRNLVEFASITGWRSGACRSRRFSDIRDGELRLDRASSKNKKPYLFPVRGPVARIVAEQEAQRRITAKLCGRLPETLFFDHETGEPIRYNQLKYRWHKACVTAGLVDGDAKHTHVFHDLRRTAIRNMERRGVTEKGITELAGAETPSIIRRYSIFGEQRRKEEADKLFREDGTRESRQGDGRQRTPTSL